MKKEIKISPYGSLLIYKKEYSLEFIRSVIHEKKLKGLRVFSQLKEDKLSNLDFLSEYSFLEALDITSVDDYDYGFLSKLKNLKKFSISTAGTNPIDLSNQLNLDELVIQWRKSKILGLEKCQNLKSLCLIDFKENDFSPINHLLNLKELIVKTSSLKDLNGVQNLNFLENLLLGNCRSLKTIETITHLKNLTSLHLELCSKIEDYSFIGDLINLKKLELIDCKGINSVKFVEKLKYLEELSLLGTTDVLDSDMQPAKNIKTLFYRHRKHYNLKFENQEHDELMKCNLDKIKASFNK